MLKCESCGEEFVKRGSRGRVPRFCGQTCRKRASRRRASLAARGTDLQVANEPWSALVAATPGRWTRADVFGDDTKGKRPKQVNGRWASSTNPATWSNFDDVQTGPGVGFGVMVGSGVGVCDLDACFTEGGELSDWARGVLATITEPVLFVERSVSGRGLHVFIEAEEGPGSRVQVPGGGGVERYSKSRFIRTTLDAFTLPQLVGAHPLI